MIYKKLSLKDYYPFLGEDGKDPVLDIYLPENLRKGEKKPCLIICPGGGYAFCSEREAEVIGVDYLSERFNVFVLWYSVWPHKFPTQLTEVAAVMELIYKNSDEWECDTEKIAIMGFSAGGHVAGHYTNKYNCEEVRAVFPESKGVNASILCYPVITADERYSHSDSFLRVAGNYPLTEEQMDIFSLERCVTKDTPPTFIWHNAGDDAVPPMNSLLYCQALSKNKVPFEMHIFPNGVHGLATCDKRSIGEMSPEIEHTAQWIPLCKKWLKTVFGL